jgi:maltokinase
VYPDEGYRRPAPADLMPVDALPVGDNGCLAVFGDERGGRWCLPLVRERREWRLATDTDALSVALTDLLMAGAGTSGAFRVSPTDFNGLRLPSHHHEHRVAGDQTHISAIVDDKLIVKWFSNPASPEVVGVRLHHLRAAGFSEMPRHYGEVTWQEGATTTLVATVTEFLPNARDGWTWCVEGLREHLAHSPTACDSSCPGWFAAELGAMLGRFHAAAATPTSVLPEPVVWVEGDEMARWAGRCAARVREALTVYRTELGDTGSLSSLWAGEVARITSVERAPTVVVHGDLHVGQILRSIGGNELTIIDLEGDPLDSRPTAFESPLRDLAHLLTSVALVGEVVKRRIEASPAAIEDWAAQSAELMLASYMATMDDADLTHLVDARLVRPLVVERLASELVYATRFLPRWAYAPLGLARSSWLARLPMEASLSGA